MKPTLEEVIETVMSDICDNYCKYPGTCKDDAEVFEHCDQCPLNRLERWQSGELDK